MPVEGNEHSFVAVATAGLLLGLLVLSTQTGPFSQMIGALRIENAIAVFELGGAHDHHDIWHADRADPDPDRDGPVVPLVPVDLAARERREGQRGRGDELVTWLVLVGLPALAALALFAPRVGRHGSAVLVTTAALTSIAAIVHAVQPSTPPFLEDYLRGDETAQLFSPVINFIFLGVTVYVRARVRPRVRAAAVRVPGARVPRGLEPRPDQQPPVAAVDRARGDDARRPR